MLYLVSYDIGDDGRRRRVFEKLKDYGRRVQFSVFECDMGEPDGKTNTGLLEQLLLDLRRLVDEGEDSIRIYCVCARCEGQITVLGVGDRYERKDYYVI